mgnify:CR=1 FL=1
MSVGGHCQFGDDPRICAIADIDNGRARRRAHMADIGVIALDNDLSATRAVKPRYFFDSRLAHHAGMVCQACVGGNAAKRLIAWFFLPMIRESQAAPRE